MSNKIKGGTPRNIGQISQLQNKKNHIKTPKQAGRQSVTPFEPSNAMLAQQPIPTKQTTAQKGTFKLGLLPRDLKPQQDLKNTFKSVLESLESLFNWRMGREQSAPPVKSPNDPPVLQPMYGGPAITDPPVLQPDGPILQPMYGGPSLPGNDPGVVTPGNDGPILQPMYGGPAITDPPVLQPMYGGPAITDPPVFRPMYGSPVTTQTTITKSNTTPNQ